MKSTISNHRSLPTVRVLALAVASAGSAYAQVPQQGEEPAMATGGLEEVIVTARKREESVQDVPVLVTAFSSEQIREKDLTSIEKLAATTPNFNVGRASNGSGAQITMRGIGSSSTSIGIEQSVAVIVDGAYYGQGRVIQEGFFDLASVEILKGPQALFFGKNATAGVINLITADPGEELEIKARASYEFEAETTQLEGMISTPITDTFGVRLAVRGTDMNGGYYDNAIGIVEDYGTFDFATNELNLHDTTKLKSDQPGEEELLARLTLKWDATDDLSATLKYTYDESELYNSSWNYSCYASKDGFSTVNGTRCNGGFKTRQTNMPLDIAENFPNAKKNNEMYNEYKSDSVTLNLNWELEKMTWNWVNNWQKNQNDWACNCDFQASPLTLWATEDAGWEAWSSELRMLTHFEGPFNLMLGVYYQDTKRDFSQWVAGGVEDSTASPQNRYMQSTKTSETEGDTTSIFGQIIWSITDTLEATVGARYIDETKDSFFVQPYVNVGLESIFRSADEPLGYVKANQDFDDFLPEVTLSWTPTDDVMVYGAYKTSYKSGGFSNGGINSEFSPDPLLDLVFDEETAEGFEVGAKSTLMDNQMRLNGTAYYFEYTDLQVDFFRSDIFAFNTVNADAVVQGVEVEVEYAPHWVSGLTLRGMINYNKSEYDNSVLPCYYGQTAEQGCTLTLANGYPGQNVDSAPTSVAPEWTGLIGARYEMYLGSSLYFAITADARYSDDYLASGFNHPLSEVDSYWYMDGSIRLGSDGGGWEVALIGKNLTDEFYITGVVDGPNTPPAGTPLPGQPGTIVADQLGFGNVPRTIAVEATYRF